MRFESVVILVAAGSTAAAFWGCGDDETGPGGSSDGGGGAASSSSTGVPIVASSSSSGGGTSLGEACDTDSDCTAGEICVTSSQDHALFLGGPANGYCTIDCSGGAPCPGEDSICVEGICLLGCETGPELEFIDDPLDENKCHGREDLGCRDIGDGFVCYPICGSDSQCPVGRVCDPRLAVCVTDPTMGLPDGSACNPDANPPECEGVCVNFTSGETMCSNRCVLGGELDSLDCGGLTEGVCVFRPSGYGPGDQGFCSPSCEVQSDCQNPDWWCFSNTFAPQGFCFGTADCPNGQADCEAADPGTTNVCTNTIHGPKCLDPAIPLGGAGTGGAGGGGGGGVGGAGGAGGGGGAGGS
jgi:hypothetical protein